jgi:hypothetical protein
MRERSLGRARPGLQGRAGEKSGFFQQPVRTREGESSYKPLPPSMSVRYLFGCGV